MPEFKVIGKDWGKTKVEYPDGRVAHLTDAELNGVEEVQTPALETEGDSKGEAA